MKQFRNFTAEQKHINEIGPVGATIAGVMGLIGGYKAVKAGLKKFKGYRETKKERQENPKGKEIIVPVFDKESGKMDSKEVKLPKSMTNSEVKDFVKKFKDKADDQADIAKISVKKEPESKPKNEIDPEDDRERDEKGHLKNQDDAQNEYEKSKFKRAPDGWVKDPNDNKKVIKSPKSESVMLKFEDFIQEDVVSDLKKISKSKKDMEIKLSDGSEIPIDPMTADIFVKYIEGLKSSEQKRVINQIQRTERGFMKVLGKAHGE